MLFGDFRRIFCEGDKLERLGALPYLDSFIVLPPLAPEQGIFKNKNQRTVYNSNIDRCAVLFFLEQRVCDLWEYFE